MEFDRDFGVNQVFVEDQYERWRNNPSAVDPQWQKYFGALQTSAWTAPARVEVLQESVAELINAWRIRGHLFADLDPLGLLRPPPPELEPEHFGLSEAEMDQLFAPGD